MATVSAFLLFLVIVLLSACSLLPHASADRAPPPPPPPQSNGSRHEPTDAFRGWLIQDVATDPKRGLTFFIDNGHGIGVLNTSSGASDRPAHLHFPADSRSLYSLTVDSSSRLVVTGWSREDGAHLLQFDDRLQPLRTLSLERLEPPLSAEAQVVADSQGFLYLFPASFPHTEGGTAARVWVLDSASGQQVDSWEAPIRFSAARDNRTDYILAIDGQDTLYFQQTGWEQLTFLVSTGGEAVETWNRLGRRRRPEERSLISDIAIDGRQTLNVVRQSHAGLVERFDRHGEPLPPFEVLSGERAGWSGPQLAVDHTGRVQVTEPVDQAILLLSEHGDIHRSFSSHSASFLGLTELLQDDSTGDLIFSTNQSPVVAQRVSAHDGAILQLYSLPARLSEERGCRPAGLDVASRLYVLLECEDERGSRLLVHVIGSSGQTLSEFRLPFRHAGRIRVDEWADRLYVPSPPDAFGHAGRVEVSTLDGQPLGHLEPELSPALGRIDDLVVDAPSHSLLLLDGDHHRIVRLSLNGTLEHVHDLGRRSLRLGDIAVGPHGSVLYSELETLHVNGSFTYRSGVLQLNSTGHVEELYVGYGDREQGGPFFSAISLGHDGRLFAYDRQELSVFVWEHHPHPPSPPPPRHDGSTGPSIVSQSRVKMLRAAGMTD